MKIMNMKVIMKKYYFTSDQGIYIINIYLFTYIYIMIYIYI